MAYTPTNTFVDGSVAVEADVNQNLDEMRTYVNEGVAVGDITDASLRTENFMRPELHAGAYRSAEGQFQSAWYARRGLTEQPTDINNNTAPLWGWANRAERDAIDVQAVSIDNESQVVPHMARRIRCPGQGGLFVSADWSAVLAYDNDNGGTPDLQYPWPGGAAGGSDGGVFLLRADRVRNTLDQLESSSPPTVYTLANRRHIYPQLGVNLGTYTCDPKMQCFNTWAWFDVPSQGVFDVYLEFNRDALDPRFPCQVLFGQRNLVVEFFPG